MADRVFTGDTLLIRGSGRTDFQNGDPRAQYDSLFSKLLKLPDETLVFPAHDYKGDTVSTVGEEKRHNPRLQARSAGEYADLMNNLNLANPKMMDVAVPANMRQGLVPGTGGDCSPRVDCQRGRDEGAARPFRHRAGRSTETCGV
jgi:sulfur dioxygenase